VTVAPSNRHREWALLQRTRAGLPADYDEREQWFTELNAGIKKMIKSTKKKKDTHFLFFWEVRLFFRDENTLRIWMHSPSFPASYSDLMYDGSAGQNLQLC